MKTSTAINPIGTVKGILILLSCIFFQISSTFSQNGTISTTLPMYLEARDVVLSGKIHMVVQSNTDEMGCVHYTVKHNGHNLEASFQTPGKFVAETMQSEDLEIIVCDEDECLIQGELSGIMKMVVWTTLFCFEYKIMFSWNRCTNTWNLHGMYGDWTYCTPKASSRIDSQPSHLHLHQNFPNPFNPTTRITYDIPEDGVVSLRVFDVHGRQVSELVNEIKTAGRYSVMFDGSKLASGVYVYRLDVSGKVLTGRMTMIK